MEEEKLLRALISTLLFLPTIAVAQSMPDATTHGHLIDERLGEAAAIGEDLKSRLQIIEQDFDLPDDIAERALQSLENGRVRELLNAGEADLERLVDTEERYPGGVFLFASFSIPDPSLKVYLQEADRLGVPVVFNGFVQNSVAETEIRVHALYEDESISNGFIIDPTLFDRFDVTAVPTLISTTVDLDVCETSGCADDATPPHDRVAGNIPLVSLLDIIAKGNADHAAPARAILEAGQ
ncbi:type-F conjugative transfer system pilin assembly protein TrbC [Yoonia sp. SS1-5]|uniref:Type-F conjugative transfer system pilin assembly protein TrbC n=1 Tax=Yoonia rhodophyticola TaxID=3137370 RepID=A0AAN0NJ63_9RHOB